MRVCGNAEKSFQLQRICFWMMTKLKSEVIMHFDSSFFGLPQISRTGHRNWKEEILKVQQETKDFHTKIKVIPLQY